MTDQPEKRHEPEAHRETEDAEADFEGQRHAGPEKTADTSDMRAATEDEGADFEGHRHAGPEKHAGPERHA